MTRTLAAALSLSLAACSPQKSETPAANDVASEPVAQDSVPSLEGNWAVESIDGLPVSSSAMTASFAGGKVSIASGCVRRGLTYTQKRNVVSFAADPGGSSNCEGRGTSAEHESAYAALQGASIAIFGKDGREANLSGTGGNLTLKRR